LGLLDHAQRAMTAELGRRLVAHGIPLRPAHSAVFSVLPAEGARLTLLAEHAQVTKQSMGELVATLVERGILTQVPDPTDKRAKIIRYTEYGWEVVRVGERLLTELEEEVRSSLGDAALTDLREGLSAVAQRWTDPDPDPAAATGASA
jgi:DNA-binding MarR family transcriptional regulator